MKTPRFNSTRLLQTAALVIAGLVAAPLPSEAGNPFKTLHSKVKSKVSKVANAVHPKRVGSALLNGTTSAVEWMNPGPTQTGRSPYYYNTRRESRPDDRRYRQPQPEYYVAPESYRRGQVQGYSAATQPRSRQPLPPPARYDEGERDREIPSRRREEMQTDSTARETPGDFRELREDVEMMEMREDSARFAEERAKADAIVPEPEKEAADSRPRSNSGSPKADLQTKAGSATATEKTVSPAPSPAKREDLPFGQPVIGKTGYVYSPYSKDGLVDVTNIPSGTRVECPYTRKHFRVP